MNPLQNTFDKISYKLKVWAIFSVCLLSVVYEGTMEISTLMGYPLSFFA